MATKDAMQKRIQRFVGLKRGFHESCINTEVLRTGNPFGDTVNVSKLRAPKSYLNRQLPSKNPFHLRANQCSFNVSSAYEPKKVPLLPPLEPKTICDIDEQFFQIVEGRVIRPNQDVKFYMTNIRNIAMSRASRGFILDQVIRLDVNEKTENTHYEESYHLFRTTKQNFTRFLSEDYTFANEVQDKAGCAAILLAAKKEEFDVMVFRFVELRSILSAIRVDCTILARYRSYLNRMSPLSWRERNDEVYREETSNRSGKILQTIFIPRFDVENHEFKENELVMVINPKMYFREPEEVMNLFNFLEIQSLNYLHNHLDMSVKLNTVLVYLENFRRGFELDVSDLKALLEIYEEQVAVTEDRAVELESVFQELLHGTMRHLVSSQEVIMLDVSVEWAHMQLLGDSLGRGEVVMMMQRIEELYLMLAGQLDLLDGATVRAAEHEYFAQSRREACLAQRAHAELVRWSNMTRALHNAFDPPRKKINLKRLRNFE